MMSADDEQVAASPTDVQPRGTKRNRPNDSPDAKCHLLSKKLEMCDHCSKEFTASCEVLQCDLCASLVHAACEGVDKEDFQLESTINFRAHDFRTAAMHCGRIKKPKLLYHELGHTKL